MARLLRSYNGEDCQRRENPRLILPPIVKAEQKRSDYIIHFPYGSAHVASTPVLKPPRLAFPLLRRVDLTEFHQVIKQVTPEVEVFIPAILCLYNLSEILNERATLKLREDEDPGGCPIPSLQRILAHVWEVSELYYALLLV